MAKKQSRSAVVDIADPEPGESSDGVVTDLVLREADIQIGKFFRIGPNGLVVTGRPTFDVCDSFSGFLQNVEGGIQFAIGDFINWVEGTFGEEASQIVDAEKWSESTVTTYRWVAARVDPRNRRMSGRLTFSHHQEVADLEPSQQVLWLERAEAGDGDGRVWSVFRLRRELKALKDGAKSAVVARGDIFQVIVACESQADMEACCRQLDTLGRTYKTKSSDNA